MIDVHEYDYAQKCINHLKKVFDDNFKTMDDRVKGINKFCINEIYLNKTLKNLTPYQQKQLRGFASELFMSVYLEKYCQGTNFKYLTDLIIPVIKKDGLPSTTQLDTILITKAGILVIEAKSVFGIATITDSKIISKTGYAVTEIAPWKQNAYHIYALKQILKKLNLYIPMYNVVFLYGICRLNKVSLQDNEYLVAPKTFMGVLDYIINNSKPVKFDINNTHNICRNFIPTREQAIAHINALGY